MATSEEVHQLLHTEAPPKTPLAAIPPAPRNALDEFRALALDARLERVRKWAAREEGVADVLLEFPAVVAKHVAEAHRLTQLASIQEVFSLFSPRKGWGSGSMFV